MEEERYLYVRAMVFNINRKQDLFELIHCALERRCLKRSSISMS